MDEDVFVLKNGIAVFINQRIPLDKEYEVLVGYNAASTIHYVKFRTKGKKRWGRYYGIDLVDPKDLKEIISILESKGVTVVTKDLREV